MAVLNLTGNIPLWEGQGLCEPYYGRIHTWLGRRDCSKLIAEMERGSEEIPYAVEPERGDRMLPFDLIHGNCMIQVEAAGPNLPSHINVVPDRLISMAEYVFNNCIKNPDQRVGGFVTSDLSRLESYVTSVRANLNEPYPPFTAFFTVTMTTLVPDWLSPGDYDPEVGYLLFKKIEDLKESITTPTPFKVELDRRSRKFFHQARRMDPRGQRVPWWPPREVSRAHNSSGLTLPGSARPITVS